MKDIQDSNHSSQSKTNAVNELACPLCGESNGCSYAAGKPHSECWCNHASFPEGVFERIPAEKRRKSCICQRCLDTYVREQV
ncbi:cysteine-rich CWC family protein [Paenibacillus silvae]|uniref:cysteine-rich CWC family protein n=1 Tax=Paenibacillus silvae TaxID=1325358 RepID=UPI0025A1E39E|nr:cysteine-rich CWC family protein [Paenibacillus silvae]MDM5276103.1 cysteine-rich CWC family protein [Paenibacillus silvae]